MLELEVSCLFSQYILLFYHSFVTFTSIGLFCKVLKCLNFSAGVGRTGTFIALDNLLEEAKEMNSVNPLRCVREMRERRPCMIQVKVMVKT